MPAETTGQVGAYDVLRPIGAGGMATVYLARHRRLGRQVALKRLDFDGDDPSVTERFLRESQLAARLHHPNVVAVHDAFEEAGVAYLAMEYVPGGPLSAHLRDLTPPAFFGVLEGVLAALAYTEAQEIVHRDLKPDNVLVTATGGVKLTDFGIAKAYAPVTERLTAAGFTLGTPDYMAPEQAMDLAVGPATDLYAVGVMAFEMLLGRVPFEGDAPAGVMFRHVNETPPRVDVVDPQLDAGLGDWVEWLLAKEPRERPACAHGAWEALEPVAMRLLARGWRADAPLRPAPAPEPPKAPPVSRAVTAPAPTAPVAPAAPPAPAPPAGGVPLTAAVAAALVAALAATAGVGGPPIAAALAVALVLATGWAVRRLAARRHDDDPDGPIRPDDRLT